MAIKKKKDNEEKENNKKKVSSRNKLNKEKIIKKKNKNIALDTCKTVDDKNREIYSTGEVVGIMIFSLCVGFVVCIIFISLILGRNYFTVVDDLSKVIDTYYAIVDNYYGNLDKESLIDGSVEGMISSVGDTFTSYTDSTGTEEFDETIGGSYQGIGCSVATYSDGSIIVIDVFDGSPSHKAGLKVGDKIIKVDNESFVDKDSNDVSSYIKNSGKDSVIITVVRDSQEIDITISLDKVDIPYVSGDVIEKDGSKIGYIDISLFSNNSYKQFKSKLEALEKENIDGLIIDVRDNSGGYLTSVSDICNLFLKKGKFIYKLENPDGSIEEKKDNTKEKRAYGVAVIINEGSASASEILASAIKESYDGYVVGTNSYGKGTVQETKKFLDGSMIKYTTQKWLTPDGNSIDKIGVVPTNYVELSNDYYANPSISSDNQIQEAIKLLIK